MIKFPFNNENSGNEFAKPNAINKENKNLDSIFLESSVNTQNTVPPDKIDANSDIYNHDSKNGEIESTKQHQTGDCWLLSGINAMSYTEEGRKIIKNALEYQNGFTTVHLLGIGDYRIDDSEIELVKSQIQEELEYEKYLNGSLNTAGIQFGIPSSDGYQYSSGDDDMIIFELAIEKALDDIADGKVMLDTKAPSWLKEKSELNRTTTGNSSLQGGSGAELMYLITGKLSEISLFKNGMEEALKKIEANKNKNIAASTSFTEGKTVKDINNKDVELLGNHAYAIKSVKDNTVVIVDPHDSSVEISLDRNLFLDIADNIEKIDLSDNNKQKSYYSSISKMNSDNEKVFIFFDKEFNDYNNIREIKYNDEGKAVESTLIENGKKVYKVIFNPEDGKVKEMIKF